MDDKRFESVVYELEKLLVESGASVTLDGKVRDEFTGGLRQVDIVIDRSGYRTCVECRAHKPKQNVKWIEELVGRAGSLGAHEIIGASLSGFTKPAVKMAKARGIILRDLSEIDVNDASGWGKPISISYRYCVFSEVQLKINFLPQFKSGQVISEAEIDRVFRFLVESHDLIYSFGDVICRSEKLVRGIGIQHDRAYNAKGRVYFGSNIFFEDLYISSVDLVIPFQFKAGVHQSTSSRVYKDPRVEGSTPLAGISLFKGNDWGVFYAPEKSFIQLDCGDFHIYENAMVYEVKFSGLGGEAKFDIQLINPLIFRAPDNYKASVSYSFSYTPIPSQVAEPEIFFNGEKVGNVD